MTDLVCGKTERVVISSSKLAEITACEHKSVVRLIQKYSKSLERVSAMCVNDASRGIGRPVRLWFLSPQQMLTLLFFFKQSERTIEIIERLMLMKSGNTALKDTNAISVKELKNAKVVYLVQAKDGSVKVGITKNPERRIHAIKTSSGKPVSWVYTTDWCSNAGAIESRMKRHYASKNICGEWFDIDYNEARERLNGYFQEMARFDEDPGDGFGGIDLADFATGYTQILNREALLQARTEEEVGRIEKVFISFNHYGMSRLEGETISTAVFRRFCGIAYERVGIKDAAQLFDLYPEELDEVWLLESAISGIMLRGMLAEKSCVDIYNEAKSILLQA